MNKFLSLLSLAVLTVGLLGSCSKINERIDNLDKRVDGIENEKIASIESQIGSINGSISDLKSADAAINGKITELKAAAEAQQKLIDALKEADEALAQKDAELEAGIVSLESQIDLINGQIEILVEADAAINVRIDSLKSYVDTELGKTKDWVRETFATLDQYQKTADDLAALAVTVTGISTTLTGVQTSIAGLDTKIDGIDSALQGKITAAKTELEGKINSLKTELEGKIAKAVSTSEASIKAWINKLMEGYYTAAKVDAKLLPIQVQIETLSRKIATTDEISAELKKIKNAVDTAKNNIRKEYKSAIQSAIETSEGKLTKALQDSIVKVNDKITALDTRVTALEGRMTAVEGNVGKLLAMIQSVTILPAYTDGSVEADENGILTIDFVVSPAAAVKGVTKDSIKVLVHQAKVQTKAASYTTIPVTTATVDDATGDVTITADISGITPAEGKALTVAVNIKNGGISNFTTEAVPVCVAPAPLPGFQLWEGGPIFAECNVGATKPEDAGYYFWWGDTVGYRHDGEKWVSADGKGTSIKFSNESPANKLCVNDAALADYVDANGNLKSDYDAATAHLGAPWRMMTKAEMDELAKCPRTAINTQGEEFKDNGDTFAGWRIKGKEDYSSNSIFLPATGYGDGSDFNSSVSRYLTATPSSTNFQNVQSINLSSNAISPSSSKRYNGHAVRAVRDAAKPLPDGALAGEFTVAEGKKVHFSQGNLWYGKVGDTQTATFQFESNQYEFHGYDSANNTWGLFGWVGASSTAFSSSPEIYGVSTSNTDADYGNSATDALKKDWGTAIDDKGTWRTLSTAEWQYLFNNHSYKWASVNSVNGYVIAPDGFEGTLADSYTDDAALAAGKLVFLPAAGYRNGSNVKNVGSNGYYWSSSASGEEVVDNVSFTNSVVTPGDFDYRSFGFSVRLVTEVK